MLIYFLVDLSRVKRSVKNIKNLEIIIIFALTMLFIVETDIVGMENMVLRLRLGLFQTEKISG